MDFLRRVTKCKIAPTASPTNPPMADARPVPKGSPGDVPTNDPSVFAPTNIPTMAGSMNHTTREGTRGFTLLAGCDSGGEYGFIASKTLQSANV